MAELGQSTPPETSSLTRPDRRGVVTKCPVCGSQVDAEAYHCPHCHNDFCFHCRARLLGEDTQLQCVNQDCDYYGKLVCALCDQGHEKEEDPAVYSEPEDGYWPGWLIIALILFGYLWFKIGFLWALLVSAALFGVGGYLLHRLGLNLFGRTREVEFRRKSVYHTCLCCGEPVKRLSVGGRRGSEKNKRDA